jgi:hypothetical protein
LGYHIKHICLIHNVTNRVMNANYRNLKDYKIVDGTLIHLLHQFHTLKGIMTDKFDVYNEIDYV